MKTKKLKKRSFVGAIALLVISAITLTTSTFAWFSMGQDAKIETMDLTVSSPEGFEISVNAEENGWTSVLTPTEIFNLVDGVENYSTENYQANLAAPSENTNYLPTELKPVSCAFVDDANFFSAVYASRLTKAIDQTKKSEYTTEVIDGVTFVHNPAADEAGFVAFDLYIKSGYKADTRLFFDKSEFIYNAANTKGNGGTAAENMYATSALRVAFVDYGNIADMNADSASARALSTFEGVTVFEPDPTLRANGSTGSAVDTQYVTDEGTKIDVDDANKVFTSKVAAFADDGSTKRLIQKNDGPNGNDGNQEDQYITISYGVNKFRVFIWIEGNDIDCRDSIGSDNLSATFRFQIDRNAEFTLDD